MMEETPGRKDAKTPASSPHMFPCILPTSSFMISRYVEIAAGAWEDSGGVVWRTRTAAKMGAVSSPARAHNTERASLRTVLEVELEVESRRMEMQCPRITSFPNNCLWMLARKGYVVAHYGGFTGAQGAD